jgi:diphthine-ammonia ligase
LKETQDRWAISWSGGKDCTMALLKCLAERQKVSHLVTVMRSDGRSAQHRIPQAVLEAQAKALGMKLATAKMVFPTYLGFQASMNRTLEDLKKNDSVTGCVFGDIDAGWRKQSNERMCQRLGLKAYHPLWGLKEGEVVQDFINKGFKAMIIAINTRYMGEEWLGRYITKDTTRIFTEAGIDPGGERGEFHTIVTGGPIFRGEFHLTKRVVTNSSLMAKHLDLSYMELKTR